jgi:hypothetical protein
MISYSADLGKYFVLRIIIPDLVDNVSLSNKHMELQVKQSSLGVYLRMFMSWVTLTLWAKGSPLSCNAIAPPGHEFSLIGRTGEL